MIEAGDVMLCLMIIMNAPSIGAGLYSDRLFRRKDTTAHCSCNDSSRSRNKLGPVVAESQSSRSQQRAYHAS
jgi:hypothetical protein